MAKGALENIYEDSQDLGRFLVSISVLITIIISVVVMLYAVLLVVQHEPHTASADGEAVIVDCKQLGNGLTRCSVTVTYIADGKPLLVSDEIDVKSPMKVGDKVTVRYDPDRVEDAIVGPTPRQTGLMLISGSLIMLLIAIVSLWFVRRFALVASGVGVSGVIGLF